MKCRILTNKISKSGQYVNAAKAALCWQQQLNRNPAQSCHATNFHKYYTCMDIRTFHLQWLLALRLDIWKQSLNLQCISMCLIWHYTLCIKHNMEDEQIARPIKSQVVLCPWRTLLCLMNSIHKVKRTHAIVWNVSSWTHFISPSHSNFASAIPLPHPQGILILDIREHKYILTQLLCQVVFLSTISWQQATVWVELMHPRIWFKRNFPLV